MKKEKLVQLAIVGLTSGVALLGQTGLVAQEQHSLDVSTLLAKPACKGAAGCGGATPPTPTKKEAPNKSVPTAPQEETTETNHHQPAHKQ